MTCEQRAWNHYVLLLVISPPLLPLSKFNCLCTAAVEAFLLDKFAMNTYDLYSQACGMNSTNTSHCLGLSNVHT